MAGALGTALVIGGGAAASAQVSPETCYGDGSERCIQSDIVTRDDGAPAPQVAGVTASRSVAQAASTLPVTGGDVAGLAAIGASLLAGGAAFVVVSRRRQVPTL